jgi:hypothetical protein
MHMACQTQFLVWYVLHVWPLSYQRRGTFLPLLSTLGSDTQLRQPFRPEQAPMLDSFGLLTNLIAIQRRYRDDDDFGMAYSGGKSHRLRGKNWGTGTNIEQPS